MPAEALLKPENELELLVVTPNTDIVVAERVEAVEVAEMEGGCGKMGLKFWGWGLVSDEAADEEVVVAAAKIGLNTAVRRGLVVLMG